MSAEEAAQQVLQSYVRLRVAQRNGCVSEYREALVFYREAELRVLRAGAIPGSPHRLRAPALRAGNP